MTTIDYKAIAERLSSLADELAAFGHHTSEQKVDDLRTVVSLLNGMADMEPAARIYTDAELVHRDPRWGRVCWIVPECEIDGGALLYLHPAPQPIAIPAPFMHLLGHAYGLSLGTDWNRGTHAKHYRRPLLDAVAECKRWLGSAPQPQPERQPVSEPRPCTCHPDDNPPIPCAQKYALSECRPEPTEAQIEAAADALIDESNCGDWEYDEACRVAAAILRAALAAKETK